MLECRDVQKLGGRMVDRLKSWACCTRKPLVAYEVEPTVLEAQKGTKESLTIVAEKVTQQEGIVEVEVVDTPFSIESNRTAGIQVSKLLRKAGLDIHSIMGDGQCMFRSIAHQLGLRWTDLKKVTNKLLVRHCLDIQQLFVDLDEQRVWYLVQPDTWGEEVHLMIMATYFNVKIAVVKDDSTATCIGSVNKNVQMYVPLSEWPFFNQARTHGGTDRWAGLEYITILYSYFNGSCELGHYDSVVVPGMAQLPLQQASAVRNRKALELWLHAETNFAVIKGIQTPTLRELFDSHGITSSDSSSRNSSSDVSISGISSTSDEYDQARQQHRQHCALLLEQTLQLQRAVAASLQEESQRHRQHRRSSVCGGVSVEELKASIRRSSSMSGTCLSSTNSIEISKEQCDPSRTVQQQTEDITDREVKFRALLQEGLAMASASNASSPRDAVVKRRPACRTLGGACIVDNATVLQITAGVVA